MRRGRFLRSLTTCILFGSAFLSSPAATHGTRLRIEVTAMRFAFQPAEITLKKGEPVDLALKSADVAHGIRFHDLNLDVKVNKGATADVRFTPNKTGKFVGHCSVFCGAGHGTMTLTIRVVE